MWLPPGLTLHKKKKKTKRSSKKGTAKLDEGTQEFFDLDAVSACSEDDQPGPFVPSPQLPKKKKRGRPPKAKEAILGTSETRAYTPVNNAVDSDFFSSAEEPLATPKKRNVGRPPNSKTASGELRSLGRPTKVAPASASHVTSVTYAEGAPTLQASPRRRGRPPKNKPNAARIAPGRAREELSGEFFDIMACDSFDDDSPSLPPAPIPSTGKMATRVQMAAHIADLNEISASNDDTVPVRPASLARNHPTANARAGATVSMTTAAAAPTLLSLGHAKDFERHEAVTLKRAPGSTGIRARNPQGNPVHSTTAMSRSQVHQIAAMFDDSDSPAASSPQPKIRVGIAAPPSADSSTRNFAGDLASHTSSRAQLTLPTHNLDVIDLT